MTNSLTTKLDLCTFYDVDPEKVDVTPLGVEFGFFSTPIEKEEWKQLSQTHSIGDEPFFLYVGGRLQYKNFGAWLGAYATSSVKNDVRVVVAGAPFDAQEKELIASLRVGDRVSLVESPSQEALRVLFQKAHTFVYPSLYEGFGLPILEAMSGGTPVLTSDRGAMPEVGGQAALYFNPMDRESMHAGMQAAFDDEKRNRCRELGPVRAQSFTWDATAALTIDAYRKAVA
ncbi:MAG: glycosyltransferase family 1 protein [Bdellovibrionota bacterium]